MKRIVIVLIMGIIICGLGSVQAITYDAEYSLYFAENPRVEDISINSMDEESLGYFWGYVDELENTGFIQIEEPLESQNCIEPDVCTSICPSDHELKTILAAKYAHSIWIDKNDLVPWKLSDFTDAELQQQFLPFTCFFAVVDYSPSYAFSYMVENDLIKDSLQNTFYAVIEDLRTADWKDSNGFLHGIGSLDPTHTAYTLEQALTTYRPGTLSRISRRGCHTMTRITVALLKSVNIPGEIKTSGWFTPGHSSAEWSVVETVLAHGDDLYGIDRATPTRELLQRYAYYQSNIDTPPCMGDIPCLSVRYHRLNNLKYPDRDLLMDCRRPYYKGAVSCEDYVSDTFGDYLTTEELDNAKSCLCGCYVSSLDGINPVNLGDFEILARNWLITGCHKQGDINGDCSVDIGDLIHMSQFWLNECGCSIIGDLVYNGNVDAKDLMVLAQYWLENEI